MRIVTLAIAALLAGAALPALAQDGTSAPGAVAPPQDAQAPPAAPAVPAAPSVAPQPATPAAPTPTPPKAAAAPNAPNAAGIVPGTANPSAAAETAAPSLPPSPGPSGRFVFNRVDAGYLRLDHQTGQVAFCDRHAVGWVCQAVPEDRAALEKEIARLQDEVATLKSEIAVLREPPPPRPPAELAPQSSDRNEDSKRLREDFARARTAIEHAWRRLVEMIVNLQKDMMRKG